MKKTGMSLSDISEGTSVQIDSLICEENVKHRLCSLGVLKGTLVEMIKNDLRGPVIIKVLESKLAIGRKQAKNIFISKQEGNL